MLTRDKYGCNHCVTTTSEFPGEPRVVAAACRYDVMSQCWYENPAHRPTFGVIRHQLDVLLGHHRNYLDLDNIDACPPAAAVGDDGGSRPASPLPTPIQLVLDEDADREGDEDCYIDSSPLVVDGASRPSTPTSTSSSTVVMPQRNAAVYRV